MIRHVIWDWNGTLLNDVDCCVDVLNGLLQRRGLPPVSRAVYRQSFGFPVRPFYADLGFDVSDGAFAALCTEFISSYKAVLGEVTLHAGALDVMANLAPLLEGQVVVSAMEHTLLGQMLADYGVAAHLQAHQGTQNSQAGSKVDVGVALVKRLGLAPDELLLVGDTAHDHELAQAIGCAVVLHAGGHQNAERLRAVGCTVVEDLASVLLLVQAAAR